MRARRGRFLQQVAEYDGRTSAVIEVTQLEVNPSAAARIVREWCEFFAAEPTPITALTFVSRTPKRLFASLRGQAQLKELRLKWGDYDDLSALEPMQHLEQLDLGHASHLIDLQPLARLQTLRRLELSGTVRVHNYSPIGELRSLEQLAITGPDARGRLHMRTIGWLRSLKELREFTLGPLVDDHDYEPLLALQRAQRIHLSPHPAMHPSWNELLRLSPGVRRAWEERLERTIPATGPDGRPAGAYRLTQDGRVVYEAP